MNPQSTYLTEVLIILAAAITIVPVFRWIGVSAVLGYLFAGIVVGPSGFGWIREVERIQMLADFGVVFLLFSIGLDLSFRRVWGLRRQVFGMGLLQVVVSGTIIWQAARALGVPGHTAVVLGGALALSSTAIVLQVLVERRELSTPHGRAALSVLLLQDLAVVPLLTLLPLLGAAEQDLGGALGSALLRSVVVLLAVFGAGRLLLRPLLKGVARGQNPELFTGIALLLVLGVGAVTQLAGLSMALGAFLAGLLIAETEYRPQVTSDVAPFRDCCWPSSSWRWGWGSTSGSCATGSHWSSP